ncbi:hypothetical protein F511_11783 [Dorcoceras hygrometricum]|uniref:LNS2/PITP domain-containing protein n=1 Tax=Dorcoceras hygrometricum TaxID=472368 RepID=A0A2Z7CET1_9LAMI|nr:hypothetical protein F511_11783 [Dorcoceras hygrometricum]
MHLDHKGEAYFLKEVYVEEEPAFSPPSSSGEDIDRQSDNTLSASNAGERKRSGVSRTNSRPSQILEHVFGREEHTSGVIRTESLERAEIAADLLELKWCTNLASSRSRNDNTSRFSAEDVTKDVAPNSLDHGCTSDKLGDISRSSSQELESNVDCMLLKCLNLGSVAEPDASTECAREDVYLTDELSIREDYNVNSVTISSEPAKFDSQLQESDEKYVNLADGDIMQTYESKRSEVSGVELGRSIAQENISCNGDLGEASVNTETAHNRIESISDMKSGIEKDMLDEHDILSIEECLGKGDQFTVIREEKISLNGATLFVETTVTESYPHSSNYDCVSQCISSSRSLEEKELVFANLDQVASTEAEHLVYASGDHEVKESNSSCSFRVADGDKVSSVPKSCPSFSLHNAVINDYVTGDNLKGRELRTISSDAGIDPSGHVQPKELTRKVRSFPDMWPLDNNLEVHDGGHSFNPLRKSRVKSAEDAKFLKESEDRLAKTFIGNPLKPVNSLRGRRRSWPFSLKISRSVKVSHPSLDGCENSNAVEILEDMTNSEVGKDIKNVNNTVEILEDMTNSEVGKDITKVKVKKMIVKTLTPTSEQLMSLKLKEGKNIVVFTFSTSMLGKQQVDARMFLWRWDTKIVISDVDGTITRSDLLGQVMPLVGVDWSQIGVAHLFSAIKENGYQFLFLSARSISQAFHTRQLLFNIKQDGKALPDGPVVISPDGLFPSLFREVVRRAPHEFKIGCLEDIKALFPADKNPFYAGFGNRDTDEFSYLKVGIPRGKIFIINPKGEIAVNRRVDTKSYVSLHTLVHGMFPSMSSCEQEDFNSWNYWKLPPPAIDV